MDRVGMFPDYYEKREIEKERWYRRLPTCTICGRKIHDETYVKIFGYEICHECIESDCTVDNDVVLNK